MEEAIRPAAGRTIEAVVLYAPQRDGQEKQLCYSPRSGVDWVSRSAIRPAAGRTIEAVVLYAPQRDGQEKQLCYSPRSWASKSKKTGKVI